MSTYEFEQRGGTQRISGILKVKGGTGAPGDVPTQQANGDLLQAPGVGSMPGQAIYSGNPVSIGNAADALLTWDALSAGAELLDRTDPTLPLFLAPGCYAISLHLSGDALTPGGICICTLNVAELGIVAAQYSATPDYNVPLVVTAVVADITNPLYIDVTNSDGASSRSFVLSQAVIVKLS